MITSRTFGILFALGAFAASVVEAQAPAGGETVRRHGCGTARQFEERSTGAGNAARVAAVTKLWGRRLVTPHFAIHYTLGRNVHQPVLSSAETGLRNLRDSLNTVHAAATPARRDSLVNAALDSLGAPHPAFITQAAAYFENAYLYYADSLGMRRPDSNVAQYFNNSVAGKFNVDIADIDHFLGYLGTYGITDTPVPPYSARIIVDNDFLYNAAVNSGGTVSGTPIVNRATQVNYNVEWDQGLAVTIAHEYYHAVQFKYTPSPNGFHSWYELGAVAMEERLAPTVNDYLGYLTAALTVSTPVSILETGGTDANYGNGIFHIFLSQKLGKTFDVTVWEALRNNGNNLGAALVTGAGSQARWDSLYMAYAASLSIAGRPGSAASPLAFSPDFALWPRPRLDSAIVAGPTTLSLNRLTYRLISPVSSAVTTANYSRTPGSWRVAASGATFTSQFLADSTVFLAPNGALALAVANPSTTENRSLTLKRTAISSIIVAYPNPATRAAALQGIQFNAPTSGQAASLNIVSESGRRVATLAADASGSFWTWNFKDSQNRSLPPGVYYFGVTGGSPQPLVVLP